MGNTDWSLVAFHNIKLIRSTEGVYVPIPYDFDWAGLVNAAYAEPSEVLRTRTVRDRIYRGFCRPAVDFTLVYEPFHYERETIRELFATQDGLSERNRARALAYLEDFFKTLEDPSKAAWEIVGTCRSI